MQIRTAVSTFALAACTLAPLGSSAASIFHRNGDSPSSTAKPVKVKMIPLLLRNRTADTMTLLVNDRPMTLAANEEASVRVAEGSNILAADTNAVKLHVTRELTGGSVSFR